MTLLNAILLGIIQGATEFLPVSSSGHLVIFQNILGVTEGNLEFTIVLHLGTLLAIFIAYWNSIKNMIVEFFKMIGDLFKERSLCLEKSKYRKYILYILVASIPAGIVGVLFEDVIESIFSSLFVVAITLAVTGVLLILGDRLGKRNKRKIEELGYRTSFFIGIFQMFAIMPGISRSGSTIVGGLFSGLKKDEAVEFSFLMSIPAVLGSLLLKIKDIVTLGATTSVFPLIIGFLCAAVVGYLSIKLLVELVQKGKLIYFSYYCFTVSICLLIYNIVTTIIA